MKPLVSIIIPIYKVECYLHRCVDSIINQTYTNLEIILVDDGSPDSCPQICDEYASKDNRIVVIHKKNGGLSDARNTGLNICRGDYISFVDSDDWINEQYIEILLKTAITENADISIGENIKTNGNLSFKEKRNYTKSFSSEEALLYLFKKNHTAFTISCGKIYKKSLFDNIRFPIGKFHEDEFTTYILYYNAKKIIYTSEILYYYYQRTGSIASTRHPWDVLDYLEQRYIFFKKNEKKELLPFLLPPLCWQHLCAYWFEYKNNHSKAVEHLHLFQKYTQEKSFSKVPLFHKTFLLLFAKYPHLYLLCRKFPLHIRKEF